MKRSFGFCVALMALVAIPTGCSPEAVKEMGKESAANATAAAGQMAEKTKAAAGEMASATGLADLMGKAQDALKSVEGGSDMLKNVSETFAKATSTFKGVTDADSATAALPDISKLTESFGGFSELFGKLPDSAKSAVASVFTSALGDLKPVLDKVLAIPGVEAILKPAIDALLEKIGSFKA
jgi:hypothetical protein